MTLKKAEYSDLKDGDKVLLQNHNKTAGIVFFHITPFFNLIINGKDK